MGYLPVEKNATWGPLRGSWVREVDKPVNEIDWEIMERYDEWRSTRKQDKFYRGKAATAQLAEHKQQLLQEGERCHRWGYGTEDAALNESFSSTIPPLRFLGPQKAKTPQQRGAQRYQDTPENASHMVGNALRMMGAMTVGFLELDDNLRKLIYHSEENPDRVIVFEDVPVGLETPEKLVLPLAAQWIIVYTIPMSNLGLAQAPSLLSRASTMQAYTRLYTIYNQLHEFIRALGYHSYGATNMNGFGPYVAFGELAGLGENSRLDCLITPERGPMVRLAAMATDLPLAPTRPISFGVKEYCQRCRICAQACPVGSISLLPEPTWEVKGPWSNPGHKAYFRDALACRDFFFKSGSNCGICFSRCPFSQPDPDKFLEFVSHLREQFPPPQLPKRYDPQGWWEGGDHPIMGL